MLACRRQPDAYCGGFCVLGDVRQGFLHQPVHHQRTLWRHRHFFQIQMHRNFARRRPLLAQDTQRRAEAQVVQRRRPQVLDDAALQRDAGVQRGVQVRHALDDFGPGLHQARTHAREVQLRGGQQAAEFVVQLTRQVAAFVFAHRLQVARQVAELAGAAAHGFLKLVTLRTQGVEVTQAVGVAVAQHAHRCQHRRQAREHQPQDAEAAVHQHPVTQHGGLAQLAALSHAQGLHAAVNVGHLLAANVGKHQLQRRVTVAGVEALHGFLELRHLALDQIYQFAQRFGFVRAAFRQAPHLSDGQIDVEQRLLEGLSVHRACGQHQAALR